jgi:hypothetical protein
MSSSFRFTKVIDKPTKLSEVGEYAKYLMRKLDTVKSKYKESSKTREKYQDNIVKELLELSDLILKESKDGNRSIQTDKLYTKLSGESLDQSKPLQTTTDIESGINKLELFLNQIGHKEKLDPSKMVEMLDLSKARQFTSDIKKNKNCLDCQNDVLKQLLQTSIASFIPEIEYQLYVIKQLMNQKLISEDEVVLLLKLFNKTVDYITKANEKSKDVMVSRNTSQWMMIFNSVLKKVIKLNNEITFHYLSNQNKLKKMGIIESIITQIL